MNAKQIITSNKAILAAALLTLGLTGCALTPATESINYQAQTGVAHVAHAENVTVNVVTTDSRAEKNIGRKINTFAMPMAAVSADEPAEVTAKRAIEQELKNRGYNVSKNSGLIVNADVTKFYSKTTQGWHMHNNAEVNLAIVVKNNESVVYTRSIDGAGETTSTWGISPKDIAESVQIALANAMTELFNDPAFIAALTTAAPAQAASK
jgi:uncharacterized lipoprotein YajG